MQEHPAGSRVTHPATTQHAQRTARGPSRAARADAQPQRDAAVCPPLPRSPSCGRSAATATSASAATVITCGCDGNTDAAVSAGTSVHGAQTHRWRWPLGRRPLPKLVGVRPAAVADLLRGHRHAPPYTDPCMRIVSPVRSSPLHTRHVLCTACMPVTRAVFGLHLPHRTVWWVRG